MLGNMFNKLMSLFIKRQSEPVKKELVSVIMLTYSRFDLFSKSIELLEQTKVDDTFDYEVIVVDNGSKEEMQKKVKGFLAKYPDIKLIRNNENLAYSYAHDEGIKAAKGDYYCFYSDDIMSKTPDWLKHMLGCMRRHKKAGIVGAKLLYTDGTIQHAGVCFHSNGNPFHIHNGEPANYKDSKKEKQFQAVTFACVLVKRETHEKIGGFEKIDKKVGYYVEDFDYCLRAGEAGYEIWFCPKAVMTHHCGATMNVSDLKEGLSNMYMKLFIEKYKSRVITEDD
jgi:O-antigen biosynthesis protein